MLGIENRLRAYRPQLEANNPRLAAFATKAVKASRKLKKPTFYLSIPLFPVRLLLQLSLPLFWMTYQLAGKIRGNVRSSENARGFEDKVQKLVDDLNENGIARWEGMYSADEIQAANVLMDNLMARSRDFQSQAKPNVTGAPDPDFPGFEHTWEAVEKEFEPYAAGDPSKIYGRTRTRCYQPPAALKTFFHDTRITEIANRYFGGKTASKRILLEELRPSLMGDGWHVDCMGKAFKAMVLLTDCTLENGPMRFKLKSHRTSAPAKKRVFHHMLKHGYNFSAVNLLEARSIPEDVFLGTGKAGDCLFFDPTGVHSGSRCLNGMRRTLVFARHAPTVQSVMFEAMGVITQ